MNWILMQNGFPPVIIRKQDRLSYYQHLETANQSSDIRPFVRFIAKCTGRTLDAYLWSTKENSLAPFGGEESEHVISVKESLTTLITMTWSFPAEALARILPSRHRDFLG